MTDVKAAELSEPRGIDVFGFFARFGHARPEPTTTQPAGFNFGTPDGYQFFLDLGPLKNGNTRWFKNKIAY